MRTVRTHGILVVDDNAQVREFLRIHLQMAGFHVFTAADAEQTLDELSARRGEVDFVLLDVDLPLVDGPSLLTLLRAELPTVRCCFMTGGVACHRTLLALGAEYVFPKPFPAGEPAATLRGLCRWLPR